MAQTDPIGALIERLCHTREQLADQLGVSPAALYSWSVGRRTPRPANRSELARIARAHALELAELATALDEGGRNGSEHGNGRRETLVSVSQQQEQRRRELREMRARASETLARARSMAHKNATAIVRRSLPNGRS